MEELTGKEGTNGKVNGNGKTNGNGKAAAELSEQAKKEIIEQQKAVDAGKGPKGKAGKASAKAKGKKANPFEAKPVPEAVKGIVAAIAKVTDLENLKAVARELKRHWKKVYLEACQKATEGMKTGNVVWFKKSGKVVEGKVVKVKSTGKVKIDADGKTWRVPGTLVHKGKPTGEDRAEVTKKAA